MSVFIRLFVFSAVAMAVSGCGFSVPDMPDFYQQPHDEKLFENIIINNVKCEIHKAIQQVLEDFDPNPNTHDLIQWIKSWGATVAFKITVDEKSGVSPGANFTRFFANNILSFPAGGTVTTAQNYTLGIGATGSADATRIETIAFTYAFSDMLKDPPIRGNCDHEDGVLI